jgi:tetratricopeptide (TPR) repeat protein
MVPALMLRDVDRLDQSIPLLEAGLERGIDRPVLIEELALQLLADGQIEAATTLLESALQRHPESAGLGRTFGLALAALPDRRAEAVPWLEKAVAAGEDGRVDLELGSLLLETGEIERAVTVLRDAVERLPDSPEAHYRLGLALQRLGETEEARAELERFRALSRQADRTDWDERKTGTVLNEAQRAAEKNRFDQALEVLAELLAARPDEDRALALRAKIFFSVGELGRALEDAARAAALLPSVAEYHYLEGTALLGLDRPTEAIASLRRALAIDDGVADVHLRLGQALLAARRPEEAIEAFTRAEGLGAEGAGLRLSWAVALEELGRFEEAETQRRQLEER